MFAENALRATPERRNVGKIAWAIFAGFRQARHIKRFRKAPARLKGRDEISVSAEITYLPRAPLLHGVETGITACPETPARVANIGKTAGKP